MDHDLFVLILTLVGLFALDVSALRLGRDSRRPVAVRNDRPDWW